MSLALEHYRAIRERASYPDAMPAEEAMQALGELTGASVRDDVTERIFSRFCVGK